MERVPKIYHIFDDNGRLDMMNIKDYVEDKMVLREKESPLYFYDDFADLKEMIKFAWRKGYGKSQVR